MQILFAILFLIYILFTLIMYVSWRNKPVYRPFDSNFHDLSATVIIPVRNESNNIEGILEDLICQTYPWDKFEVIVVDDHSTDDTCDKVASIQKRSGVTIKLVKANQLSPGYSAKKNALDIGISSANSEVIICTDGDCRVGKNWLRTMCGYMNEKNAVFVSGPVAFTRESSLFEYIQTIEFSSLIGAGATTLSMGIPTMCNGANIGFSRKAFFEVGGYQGNANIASGDDEFLMHKMYKEYPERVVFVKSSEAIVHTEPKKTISEFFQQRKRWASKWNSYQLLSTKLVAIFIFLINIITLFWMFKVLTGQYSFELFILFLILKISVEFVFLSEILKFLGKKLKLFHFLLLEFLYPYYVSFFGIFSKIGKYEWKGRKWN